MKPIELEDIEWSDMGIDTEEAIAILGEVHRLMDTEPDSRLDIRTIADSIEASHYSVKMVLFTLLALHKVVTTFLPLCVNCGARMGTHRRTVHEVESEDHECPECGDSEAEVGIIFWKPGSKKEFSDA